MLELKVLQRGAKALLQLLFPVCVFANLNSVTVPLQTIAIDSVGDNKVGIMVSVAGGPPSLLTFDTGGAGLHIMQSQVPSVSPSSTSQYVSGEFGNGMIFSGYLATVPITIEQQDDETAITTAPITVMIVQKITCVNGENCGAPASGSPMYGKFWGEFGAGMTPEVLKVQNQTNTIVNLCSPMRYLPGNLSSGFIVQNLTPSDDVNGGQGELVIGLSEGIDTGYTAIQLPLRSDQTCPGLTSKIYNDRGVNVEYQIGNYPPEALSTLFDTGGSSAISYVSGNTEGFPIQGGGQFGMLQAGLPFSAGFKNAFQWEFTSGSQYNSNVVIIKDTSPYNAEQGKYVNLGISFFFNYNVIFDFSAGKLEISSHF